MGLQKLLPAMCLAAATGFAVLAGGVAGATAASSAPQTWNTAQTHQRQDPRYVGSDGRICEKMCPHDNLPCDPLNFKIADGRCRGGVSPR